MLTASLASRPGRRGEAVVVLAVTVVFGLLLGWATYGLHGTTPLLERATNSSSTWIVWTAAAGALIRSRPLAAWAGAVMMLATCAGYYTASTLGDTFGAGGLGTAAGPGRAGRRAAAGVGRMDRAARTG
ncbi:hypothetical protein ACFZAU_20770 [Streptomyces sp. NPDC008238]